MEPKELEAVVNAWILAQETYGEIGLDEDNPWPIEKVSDWHLEGNHELLWQFILTTYKRNLSASVQAMLAAGPLEDFLVNFGEMYIEQVETLSTKDPSFRHLLRGVWKNAMTDEVWSRIQALRTEIW